MIARPLYALAVLAVPAAAADVVTILGPASETPGVGRIVGSSGSLTYYSIEDVPVTVVANPSEFHQVVTYPGGDVMSQGCSMDKYSSIKCVIYETDKSLSTATTSTLAQDLLDQVGHYVITITATNTGAQSETTGASDTASITSPASIASQTTGSQSSGSSTGTAAETTSSGSSVQLGVNTCWIGGAFAAILAFL